MKVTKIAPDSENYVRNYIIPVFFFLFFISFESAFKESGYESDSTLVFRRREDISPLSLLEQRLAYKSVQSGGDVPLHGLRKPAPERPKGE